MTPTTEVIGHVYPAADRAAMPAVAWSLVEVAIAIVKRW